MRCYPNYPVIPKCVHSNWDKRIGELNPEELVVQGKPAEDVNELLLKIMK